jgi:tetratricopeptide (TPR) repeat protein
MRGTDHWLRFLAASLALSAATAAVAATAAGVEEAPGSELAAVSLAMSRVDLFTPVHVPAGQRDAILEAPAGGPGAAAPVDRFLALYALPRDEATWKAYRGLADAPGGAVWGGLGMARVYLAWGTLDQADAEIARIRAAAPGNWIALGLRAEAQERRGRTAEARADYSDVLLADPENAAARLGMARLARQQGDVEGAYRAAAHALQALPEQVAAPTLLGTLALDLGRRQEAVAWLARASERAPRDAALRASLARARLAAGDAPGAVADWKASLALQESLEGLRGLALAAQAARDADSELGAVRRITELDPGPATGWKRLAELRMAVRDEEGAEGALRRAVERDPQDPESRLALGRILLARHQPLQALEQLRAAGEPARAERGALERRLHVAETRQRDLGAVQRAVAARMDRVWREEPDDRRGPGVVQVRVSVDDAGEATEVAIVGDTLRDEWVVASAYWNLKDASYAKGKPGRYTFKFAVGR